MRQKKYVMKVPCEIYSRVVGYYRPTFNWNKGKQQEFKDRVGYKITEKDLKSER